MAIASLIIPAIVTNATTMNTGVSFPDFSMHIVAKYLSSCYSSLSLLVLPLVVPFLCSLSPRSLNLLHLIVPPQKTNLPLHLLNHFVNCSQTGISLLLW